MLEFCPCPVDEEPAATLAQAMRDEIAALYDGLELDGTDMPKAGPRELGPPGGTFVVGYEDGDPICCGGLKRLPDGTCEIKKMFVVGGARGRGVARALLVELERQARDLGYAVARLDTGPRQQRAQALYERAGYAAIENFNANPVASFFGEKRLVAGDTSALAPGPLVSVVIPTLDEERELPALLEEIAALPGRWEIVVVDGGSRDATVALANVHPATPLVLEQDGGRAAQLNAGARAASGEILLFLHADSRLPRDAYASLAEAWRSDGVSGGNFALRFDGDGRFERVLGAVYRFQRRHGFYYGDSSVWVRRERFEELGGYREIPIMDDYDFVRRMERGPGRTRCLPGPASTSSRRWRAIGITRTVLAWFVIRWLYVAGVSPQRLVRLYRIVR